MMHWGYFDTAQKGNYSNFLTPTLVGGDAPFPMNLRSKWPTPFEKHRLRPISAYNVSNVSDSEKKFNYDEYKVDHGLSNEL